MTRRCVLLYSTEIPPWREDLTAVIAALSVLTQRGATCELKDTARMTEEEMAFWRARVIAFAVQRGLRVRQSFGSRSRGMFPFLGKQVPALFVYEDGKEAPVAVYPHRRRRGRSSRDYSITEFLLVLTSQIRGGADHGVA